MKIKHVLVLARRNFLEIIRDKLSLIFLFILPLGMLVLFYYLFSSLTSQFEITYFVCNMIVFSQAFLALFSGMLIATDRKEAFLTRLYTTNTKPIEFILSYVLTIIPLGLSQSLTIMIVASMISLRFLRLSLLLVLLLSVLSALLYISFGILFGSLCNEKSIGGIASLLVMGQSLLSGMWFPTEGLSEGFVKFIELLPFKSSSLILYEVYLNEAFPLKYLVILLIYIIIIISLAIYFYRKKMQE